MPTKKFKTQNQIDNFVNIYYNYSNKELATIYSVNATAIGKWAKKYGLKSDKRRLLSKTELDELRNLYLNGKKFNDIATHFNIPVSMVNYYANKILNLKKVFTLSQDEINFFIELGGDYSTKDLAKMLNKHSGSIQKLRKKYNIFQSEESRIKNLSIEKFYFQLEKFGTFENVELFRELFPLMMNKQLMEIFNLTNDQVYYFAKIFKCKRDTSFSKEALKQAGIDKRKSTEQEIYCLESHWKKPMFDIVHNNLKELGIFHKVNNKKGVVRDHIYSKKDGFINKVFPEILRHPANCEIITHVQNSMKSSRSGITLEELFNAIRNFKEDWHEQELCLHRIKEYTSGLRWSYND